MRQARVRMPRITNQELKGEGTPPMICSVCLHFSKNSFFFANIKAPPITSLCPPKYFVVECMAMSVPSSIGRCRAGVAQVLSSSVIAPALRAISQTAAMSTTFNIGLEGVYIQMSFVLGVTEARTLATSDMSTTEAENPQFEKYSSKAA